MPITLTPLERSWLVLFSSWFAFVFGAIGEKFQDATESTEDGKMILIAFYILFILHLYAQDAAMRRKGEEIFSKDEESELDDEEIAFLLSLEDFSRTLRRKFRITFWSFVLGLILFWWPFHSRILPLDTMVPYYWIWFFIFLAGLVVLTLFRVYAWIRAG